MGAPRGNGVVNYCRGVGVVASTSALGAARVSVVAVGLLSLARADWANSQSRDFLDRSCESWCHYQWVENCEQRLCYNCEMCMKIHIPAPPPSPPQTPMMELPLDYFQRINFAAQDGGLYANGLPLNLKAASWQGAE